MLAAGLVAVAFGGAFAVGAVTKPAATVRTPQLAPGSSATNSQHVSVVAPAAAAAIPSLAHKVVVKRPVIHHVATKKTASHARHTTASSTAKHGSTVTTRHHAIAPVNTVAPVHTTPVTTTPVNTTPAVTTPPVTTPPVSHVPPTTTTTPPSSGGGSSKTGSGTGKSGGSSSSGSGITSGGG